MNGNDRDKIIEILSSKMDMGFDNLNSRLDDINRRLELIESNNTNLKLGVQKNSSDVDNIQKKLVEIIADKKNAEQRQRQNAQENRLYKYKKIGIIISILGLFLSGVGIKYLFDFLSDIFK